MKPVWTLLVAVAVCAGCKPQSPSGAGASGAAEKPVARWHFAGGQALRAAAQAPTLREVLQLPESAGVGGRLGTNIARLVASHAGLPASPATDGTLYPLVEALLENESAGEVAPGKWWVGVRGPDRTAVLGGAASALVGSGGTARAAVAATNGWWFAASSAEMLAKGVSGVGGAHAGILTGEFDLQRVFKGSGAELWPWMQVNVISSNNSVRTKATLEFSQPPLGELEGWKVPDDFIRDPIVRFSALRGSGPLIDRVGWLKLLAGGSGPGQVVSWAQAEVTFRNWFAFPVDDGAARLKKVHAGIQPYFGTTNAPGRYTGRAVINSNSSAIAVFDLKACLPTLGVIQQGGQSFLMASFIPGAKSTNRVPAELLAQLQRPNLAFYEWEITGESARNWNVLAQFNQLVQRRLPNPVGARGAKWLLASAPRLGNTVTEVFRESPTRYTLNRKSDTGFNGLELLLLTRWIDDGFADAGPRIPVPALPGGGKP